MNYVVASLLLGRIPEQYTDIDHCTPLTAENEEGVCFFCMYVVLQELLGGVSYLFLSVSRFSCARTVC